MILFFPFRNDDLQIFYMALTLKIFFLNFKILLFMHGVFVPVIDMILSFYDVVFI